MTINLISKAEAEVPFFLKNHLTPFLNPEEQETFSKVSRHCYMNQVARSDLLTRTEYQPGVFRRIKGLAISECACQDQMARISGKTDWRKIFENIVLGTIYRHFPDKKEIRICFIGAAGGLQTLVILQQLSKIHKIARTLLLVDPIYYPDPEDSQILSELAKMADFISPVTKIKTSRSIEEMVQSAALKEMDVFLTFDSDFFRDPFNSEKEDTLLLANTYLYEINRLLAAIKSTGKSKLFLSGEWTAVADQKDFQLLTRVFFSQDGTAKNESNYLYLNDQPVSEKTMFLGHPHIAVAMPLLKAPQSIEDWERVLQTVKEKTYAPVFHYLEECGERLNPLQFLQALRETGYIFEQSIPVSS